MAVTAPDVTAEIARQRPALCGLLGALVRTDTTNPPGDTRRAVDLVASRLRSAGVDVQILADEPKKPNLLLRLGSGRPELLLLTHLDTVPPGDPGAWRHPPFGAQLVGTRLYGLGAGDPKGCAAAMVVAVETLARPDRKSVV